MCPMGDNSTPQIAFAENLIIDQWITGLCGFKSPRRHGGIDYVVKHKGLLVIMSALMETKCLTTVPQDTHP